ncbi:MAG: choice-of-anchor D domain-containing protein [Ignavibacteriae bacterium]|nr:choice-of-anchor D domain-containing protein [Ignavibacteriota bacterium]
MRTKLITTAFTVVYLALSFLNINAKDFNLTDFKNKASELLGMNNAGTDFWLTFNPAPETSSGKNDLKLYITSEFVTTVTVLIQGKGYLRQQKTRPYEIIEFTLTPALGQCYRIADSIPPEPDQLFVEYGVHVYADQPIICYAVTQYKDKGEGYLAIPEQSLGENYIVSSWADDSDNNTQFHPGYLSIVSPFDNNRVRVTLGGTAGTRTKGGMLPGETKSYTLYKGDVLIMASEGYGSDLSGTSIRASRPVSVVSSNYCATVPEGTGECNFITEMESPTNTWGKTYIYTPFYTRKNNSYVKIFAKEAGTNIYRDSNLIATLNTGAGMLDSGWIKLRADEGSTRPMIFTADKPINVVQYNCGREGEDSVNGKPFMMELTPIEQFQKEIIFCTPDISSQIYNDNYVNVVYQSSFGVLIPDDLMLGRYENGQINWQKVSGLPYTLGANYIANINDKYYYYAVIRLPERAVYLLKADNPLTAYAYGFSDNLSYGFATSISLKDLEYADSLAPNPTYFFDQCAGETSGENVVDMPQNNPRSNLSEIIFNARESYNFRLTYEDFIPGEDSSTKWQAWVIDRNKDAKAVINFIDRAGNDTSITLYYYARKITVRPELDFGLLEYGETKNMTTWIINNSPTETLVFNNISFISNPAKGFEILTPVLPFNLPPLDSIEITVRFNATEYGEFIDTIGVGDTCHGFSPESKVKAKVGFALIDVSYHDYGDVNVNSSTNGVIEIRNFGTIDLEITGYTGPRQPSIFIPDLVIEPSYPLKLAPNQLFTYEVRFSPTDTISYTDSMFFISNSIKNGIVDSVGDLYGRGISNDLVANSYDWGNKRIDRVEFPAGPYDPDNGYEVIRVENSGIQPVTIYNIIETSSTNGSAFEFDGGLLTNRVINPNEYIIVPVKFHPVLSGPHELIIQYDNSGNSKTQTILRGNGIVPKVEGVDNDFGSSFLSDYSNPVKKKVRFTNPTKYAWRYGDTLTITDLIVKPDGYEISTGTSWGTEGFRFNKSALNLPVKLSPGEYFEFEVEFVATKESQSIAYLESVSDAENEITVKLAGNGIFDEVIENLSEIGYRIYPNPADDYLAINFQDITWKPEFIKLYNSYGNVVYENKNIISDNLKISTSELASGIYFLKIGNGVVRKVLVVH